jgi:hypothetical protein
MSIEEAATTTVRTLERIETMLIILFEQQQHLSTGLLSRTDERDISSRQLHLLLQVKSAVQIAKLAVWSLVVPEAKESVKELTVYRCEPADEEEEDAVI